MTRERKKEAPTQSYKTPNHRPLLGIIRHQLIGDVSLSAYRSQYNTSVVSHLHRLGLAILKRDWDSLSKATWYSTVCTSNHAVQPFITRYYGI